MKTLTAPLQAMNMGSSPTWALCWQVTDRAGEVFRATQNDRALVIATGPFAGTYEPFRAISASSVRGNADLAVDNLNLESFLDANGITQADIDGGLFDGVGFSIFALNWQAPDDGQVILRTGTVGELSTEYEGRLGIELRGLAQALQQNIVRTYGPGCDADLGDARCTVDLAPLTVTGTVDTVTVSTLAFTDAARMEAAGYFSYGLITFTSGLNAGVSREVRAHQAGGVFILAEPLANPITVGAAYSLKPGCDKLLATCFAKFNNVINFRGFPGIKAPRENVDAPVRQ